MTPKVPHSEQSLNYGGWGWRPQLQEWHKLVWLASRDNRCVKHIPTLMRRDVNRRLIKSLQGVELRRLNSKHGFTYGEENSG